MRSYSTVFLQVIIVLVGVCVLILLLWEPHLEGRNAQATIFQIYFNDLFLAYVYLSSVVFFVALFQAFKFMVYVGRNEAISQPAVSALRIMKKSAILLVCLIAAAEAYLLIVRPGDDIAGGVAVGLFLLLGSAVIAVAVVVFEKILQDAVNLKSGNDIIV